MGRGLLAHAPFRAALSACDAEFRRVDPALRVLDELAGFARKLAPRRQPSSRGDDVLGPGGPRAAAAIRRATRRAPSSATSLGEVAAAFDAGALSLADAARIVVAARLQSRAAGSGAMAVVGPCRGTRPKRSSPPIPLSPSPGPTRPLDDARGSGRCDRACVAASRIAHGIGAQRVRVDVAYHSPALEPLCAPLAQATRRALRHPRRAFRSIRRWKHASLPGIARRRLLGAHLREPVRFAQAIAAMPGRHLRRDLAAPDPRAARSRSASRATRGAAGAADARAWRGRRCAHRAARRATSRRKAWRRPPRAMTVPGTSSQLSAKSDAALRALAARYAD
jgi:acyl transferase domain-containing protein